MSILITPMSKLQLLQRIDFKLARGTRLKILRSILGYRQQADFIKTHRFLSKGMYYRWESGINPANEEILLKIAEKENINPRWLIAGEGGPFDGITLSKKEKEEKESRFAQAVLVAMYDLESKGKLPTESEESLKMKEYSEERINPIKEDLLQLILSELLMVYPIGKPVDHVWISRTATTIYEAINETQVDAKLYPQFVKMALKLLQLQPQEK